ncbi:MAG TPA: Xaa-Pro peptidase family protein, partial [Pyrinomonadaceae bacterium]|nr:Xaa-Pro peptidase family protein [Pyrinomonadaceae bacterium]
MCLALSEGALAQGPFDKAEFAARRAKVFEQIGEGGVAVVFAADPHVHAVKFRQSPDFYYLTGIEEPGALLLLVGKTRQSVVFVERRPAWRVRVEGPGLLNAENSAEAYGLTHVLAREDFVNVFGLAAKIAQKLYAPLNAPDTLQMARAEAEMYDRGLASHPLYKYTPTVAQAVARLRELQPGLAVADVNPILDRLRWVKSPYEIERMRRSGRIGAEGMKAGMRGTRPGEYEYEVEAAARYVQTKLGARGDAFTPIVASGPNTITWHYERNDRQMQAGEIVLMDYGADFDYYTSDITRTWPVGGTFTDEQLKMYRCILEARDAIIKAMKPGVTIKQMQDVAEEVYTRHGFRQQFMELGRYVGHPVGLSVHDVGGEDPSTPLAPGVVFNVEPLLE